MWMLPTAARSVLYLVSEQQKISPNNQYCPISVNIAQYPITQYQYRSNPSHRVKSHWVRLGLGLKILTRFHM